MLDSLFLTCLEKGRFVQCGRLVPFAELDPVNLQSLCAGQDGCHAEVRILALMFRVFVLCLVLLTFPPREEHKTKKEMDQTHVLMNRLAGF